MLACDIDDIPDTLIGWTDTHNDYDVHNLIYDVPYEGSKREKRTATTSDVPPTSTDDEDQADESSSQQEDTTATDKADASTSETPKWPIYSIVKYYPPSYAKN